MSGSDQLNRFRQLGGAAPIERVTSRDPHPYTAFQISEQGGRRYLELRQAFPNSADCPSNFGITNIEGDFRYGTGVTIQYGKEKLVIIKGDNLHKLLPALLEWKVEFIAAFDPEYHQPITDDTQPVVKTMEIHTYRPDPAPPMDKRH